YAGGLCTETCGDQKRAAYVTANTNDYDVAYTATGFWANYTRTYPPGTFNVPATGGWQNYSWAPCVDALGNSVPVTTTGAKSTFQLAEDNGGFNANFLMLVPADTAKPVLSQVYPNG